jgi:hypothetical protein
MWSQYGNGHKGVCLKLNKSLLDYELKNFEQTDGYKIFCNHIKYLQKLKSPTFPQKIDKDLHSSLAQKNHKQLFYQKTDCWIGEHEYRCVKLFAPGANNGEDSFLDISKALEEVFFGKKVKKEKLKNIDLKDYSFVDFEWGQIIKRLPFNPFQSNTNQP